MYARITKYRIKPERRDEAVALAQQLKLEVLSMPGVMHFINVANDDGSGYVILLNESKELSDGNVEKGQAIWAKFADFLEEAPVAEGYDVLFSERNG